MSRAYVQFVGDHLFVDGQELSSVRSVEIRAAVGETTRVHVDVLARELDVTFTYAAVSVTVVALPGFVITSEPLGDGRTRYVCTRETA